MLAVKGNRIEERVGKRSVIELLNAEEELLALKLTFVQDRHDRLVAQASVLQAMGRLDVDLVAPGAAPYRPETALRQSLKQSVIPQDRAITMIDQIGAPRP